RDWFSAADLSCLVSSREGWPNVIQESLACGTPVLATRLWGAPEIIVSDELGLLVAQEKDAISAGLEAALKKNWDRKFIAAHAGKRTWETVAREVEEFLVSRISDFSSVSPGRK
ncbi:MAG TPA: glycosyltransferase, partial [Candidatus Nitrosotalea sp.]|nr:glycosyltransferase [Candidatus Nitrosotalea sp.]